MFSKLAQSSIKAIF
ncbi:MULTISPECIES: hypothetical protein [Enterobacteriaceae]|nr:MULTISPECIES: hypothetical protein [Enterobacteriaceae]EHK0681428.1 hypothetical protein [Escherichia coli]EHK7122211.1 hypothetical protein [Escherichia coli]EHK7126442.1 hypothetical protein [Escherichia coli]EHK7130759.1 hypothetical protein [Escherichia coli]EHR7794340.1 hypothetical protein [Escherichia coli]